MQDSAPDIYETPDLTDDNSTLPVRSTISVERTLQLADVRRLEQLVHILQRPPTKTSTKTRVIAPAYLVPDYTLMRPDHIFPQHKSMPRM